MIKVFVNNLRLLMAEDNMILTDKETDDGAIKIYLGIYDAPENYTEILEEEYIIPDAEAVLFKLQEDCEFEQVFMQILEEEVNK